MWQVDKTVIKLEKGDITTFEGDAIVNAANTDLKLGSGVAGAIRVKGGPTIQEECDTIGPIGLGEAAITRAGNLKAKYVIHAASMHLGGKTTEDALRKVIWNVLIKARNHDLHTIAFPAIGTGVGGINKELCAKIMVDKFIDFIHTEHNEFKELVVFLFSDEDYKIFEKVFAQALKEHKA